MEMETLYTFIDYELKDILLREVLGAGLILDSATCRLAFNRDELRTTLIIPASALADKGETDEK